MKKTSIIIIVAITAFLFSFKPIDKTTWILDKSHAKVGFTVVHMLISDVEGWFKTFDASLTTTKDDFSDAQVEMTAYVNSINTDNEQRDTHLKSPDFFEVEKYPTIVFKSKTFVKTDGQNYKVSGDITMHGITKNIVLDVKCKTGVNPMSKKTIAGFKITGTLNRSDFGIGTGMGSSTISDEVTLIANAEFIKI